MKQYFNYPNKILTLNFRAIPRAEERYFLHPKCSKYLDWSFLQNLSVIQHALDTSDLPDGLYLIILYIIQILDFKILSGLEKPQYSINLFFSGLINLQGGGYW